MIANEWTCATRIDRRLVFADYARKR